MDIEKAIDILNDLEADMVYTVEEIDLACLVAIDALRKQLPIEVGENLGDYENEYFCIKCNNNLNYEHQLYCEFCGQSQGW